MALGKVSSLGLGSSVLTQDVIDKLKGADRVATVDPVMKNMEKNLTKQKDLSAIKTLVSSFKSSVAALANDTMYARRNVDTDGKSASLSVDAGVGVQDISVDVKQLAARDIYQSKKFVSPESFVSREGSFILKFNNTDYKIDMKQSTSYEELAAKINDATGGQVQAKLLKVGGDRPYQLIVQSKDTGANNKIEFSAQDKDGNALPAADFILQDLGWDAANIDANRISKAQNAEFTYNGITVTRDTNSVKDLTIGINLTLKETGKTSFSVKEDATDIKKEMENIVKTYNSLINNLNVATDYNSDTKSAGTFQGVSEITSIKSTINKALFATSSFLKDGKTTSSNLTDFGFSLTKDGLLTLDSSVLNSKLNGSLEDAKMLFTNSTSYSVVQTASTKAIDGGAITAANENFTINGVKINFTTPASNDSKDNALALLKAINEAGVAGVQATLNPSEDRLLLKSSSGASIEIKGDSTLLEKFGLTAMNLTPQKTDNKGIFASLNSKLNDMVDREKGSLTIYDQNLTEEKKKLEKDRLKATQDLDTKYDMMAQRFLAYDQMINKLQSQFSTLKTMIDAELNAKK